MIKRVIVFATACLLVLPALFSCKKPDIAVSSVTLDKPSLELLVGESAQLSAEVLPANATHKKIQWASSDDTVASVSETGLVTAIAKGTAVITAKADKQEATCEVTVTMFNSDDIDGVGDGGEMNW